MLPRNTENTASNESLAWQELTAGIPSIMAFARLCGHALSQLSPPESERPELSAEAQAILYSARETGTISIRGDKNAFEPSERFLAVCVELDEGRRIEFRSSANPKQTIRFIDAFRELCRSGLVMHQLMNDFSLTGPGFDIAEQIEPEGIEKALQFGRETA